MIGNDKYNKTNGIDAPNAKDKESLALAEEAAARHVCSSSEPWDASQWVTIDPEQRQSQR
jgi:hypothetical protein